MNNTPKYDVDPTLTYPEPPASPLWHRQGPKPGPITPEQQRCNCELLLRAQYTPTPLPRTTTTPAEASR